VIRWGMEETIGERREKEGNEKGKRG